MLWCDASVNLIYFVHLGDMDRRIFYSVHNIERKQARIKCRIIFLEKCESYNIVPYGLQICKNPFLGKSSESFLSQWDQVSRTSSVEFLRLAILESKYQLQQCSEDVEVTTNLIINEYSLSTYLIIKRDVDIAISKFIVDITLRLDVKVKKFRQVPWIHSTGNPLPCNYEWCNSKMEKKDKAPFMSASINPQQGHVISICVPVGNASFSNDLPNISNLCTFQETTSTDNVHATVLLPLSGDTYLTNIEKSNNSIDLINSIPTNNVLMSSCNIAVFRNTQSLTSCHETLISYDTHGNSVIANTTSANINTSSDNMLTSVAPTKLADDVH